MKTKDKKMIAIGIALIILGIIFVFIFFENDDTNYESTETILSRIQGEKGRLWINLQWNTIDDLDLHIIDPCNNEIFHSSKTASCYDYQGKITVGRLEKDINKNELTKTPQENIFWSKEAPTGEYSVFVKHYKKNEKNIVTFNLVIIDGFCKFYIFQGKIRKNTKMQVAKFRYRGRGCQPDDIEMLEWIGGRYFSNCL